MSTRFNALALAALAAGCGTGAATWPGKAPSLEELSAEQACTAVAPRGRACINEMLIVRASELLEVSDPEATKMIGEDQLSGDAAEKLHRLECAADDNYAPAVVTCWASTDCKAFARCVVSEAKKQLLPVHGKP